MRIGTLIAVSSASLVGNSLLQLLPVWVTDLEHHRGLSQSAVGLLATIALAAVAIGAATTTRVASSPERTRWAVLAATGAAAALLTAGFVPPGAALTGLMIVAGLGAGVCAAISNACVSATADPSRVAGIVATVMIVSIAALTATLPLISQLGGPTSMTPAAMTLGGLGLVLLLAAFACRHLPPPPSLVADPTTGGRQMAPRSMHLTMFTVAVLFGFSDVGSYAFAEVLGIRQGGYSASGATLVLAASILVSLGVAIGLSVFPVRRRPRAALLTALLINTVGKTGSVLITGQIAWAGSQFVWAIGTAATIVVMLAVAASHDPTGRLAAVVATGTSVGAALGPISAGAALDSGTEARLAALVVIAMTGALLTALRVPTGSGPRHPIGSIAAVN